MLQTNVKVGEKLRWGSCIGLFHYLFVILNLRDCVSLHMEQLGSDSNSQTCLRGSLESFWNREITQRLNLITNLMMVSTQRNICSTYSRGLCFKQQHLPKDSFIRFIEYSGSKTGRRVCIVLMRVTFICLWHFY